MYMYMYTYTCTCTCTCIHNMHVHVHVCIHNRHVHVHVTIIMSTIIGYTGLETQVRYSCLSGTCNSYIYWLHTYNYI